MPDENTDLYEEGHLPGATVRGAQGGQELVGQVDVRGGGGGAAGEHESAPAKRGARAPDLARDAPDTVFEDRHCPREEAQELPRRMFEEPIGRIFGEAQNPEIQLQHCCRDGRLLDSLLSGLVGVEEQVDPIRVPAQGLEVLLGHRRAQSRHGVLNPRLVEHKDVRVSLDDERRPLITNRLRDLGETVEKRALVE